MRPGTFAAVASLALLAVVHRDAGAQTCVTMTLPGTCSASTGASVTVPRVVRLALSTTTVSLATPGRAEYDLGYAAGTGADLTVQANAAWVLAVSASGAAWTSSGPGVRAGKPSTDLLLATSPGGPFIPLGASPASFLSGGPDKGRARATYYRARWDYELDTPGTYSLAVTFTLTAP